MKRNICTLFDKNYLARGLALYDSLCEHCPKFILWILCMDEDSYELLQKLDLENVRLLRLREVEDNQLKAVKSTRTSTEYCWMFSSSLPLYVLEKNKDIDMITYIDADIYFYDSIETIYDEFGSDSIMIIPHNSSKRNKWREKTSGIYNVGMMIFRNDPNGLEALRWWKNKVIEWCYGRYEDGKYGDQLYLNDWPTRFRRVHVLHNLGANMASWNIDSYIYRMYGDKITTKDRSNGIEFPLIFYHFHGLRIYSDENECIKDYPITSYEKKIYRVYLKALQKSYDNIRRIDIGWDFGCSKRLSILRRFKQILTRSWKTINRR